MNADVLFVIANLLVVLSTMSAYSMLLPWVKPFFTHLDS